jgi:hypothetical protein
LTEGEFCDENSATSAVEDEYDETTDEEENIYDNDY